MSREKWSRRELEKLLSPGETPPPPVDLAARIKAEIPDRLPVAQVPGGRAEGRSSSRLGPWLLAASVVMALGGGLLAYRATRQVPLEREVRELLQTVAEEDRGAGAAPEAPRAPTAAGDEDAAAAPAEEREPASRRLRRQASEQADRARAEELEARNEPAEAGSEKLEARAGKAFEVGAARQAEADAAGQAEAVPPAAAAPEDLRRPEAREQALAASSALAAPRKVRLADAAPDRDAGAYALLRHWIVERSELPLPEAVRVGELVAEFDPGAPRPPATQGESFVLHAEGAPAPFAPQARLRLLRFAVAAGSGGGGGQAGSGTRVQVDFDPHGVAGWRLAGEEELSPPGRLLSRPLEGSRWAALVEVELQPGIAPETLLATLRLRSPSVATGAGPARSLRLADLASSWRETSPALRLVSLAAELGEILHDAPADRVQELEALAGKARELAAEGLGTGRAAELAELADQAAGLAGAGEAPKGH